MLTLGLDIGTTTISIVVMDKEKQKVVEAGNVLNDSFIPTEHEWEKMQDPDRILKKAQMLLDDCLMRHPQISSIGLTGQMHGIVYLDENGKAVSPLYTWQYGGGRKLLAEMGRERERKARRTEIQGNVMCEHPAEGGMQVVTTFSGTRQEPSRRGSITGISESNFTPELLTYGVLKGMAEELYAMYERMLEAGCHQAASFTASGNGLRKNPILREIFSEMFGAELIMAKFEEEAACGAALI